MSKDNLDIDNIGTDKRPFGPEEEEVIIALCIELPEFYLSVGKHLKHTYFHKAETRAVAKLLEDSYEKYSTIPPRAMLKDQVLKQFTADDDYKAIIDLIDRKPHPREIPIIKDTVLQWARHQAYGLIYSQRSLDAYDNKDYDEIEKIIEEARRIADVSTNGLWFFKNTNILFNKDTEIKLTTGIKKLDENLNDGGPTKKDVLVWMAPTGVGKSIMLINSSIACIMRGMKVLHITLEMSEHKTALRYAGAISKIPIFQRFDKKEEVKKRIERFEATYGGSLMIKEYAPDEISVDTIYAMVDNLKRTHNWAPDIITIDYLELMISKSANDNKEDYTKQKRVATQIRGMAKNLNVMIFTATQTNRGEQKTGGKKGEGTIESAIKLDRMAESYGKAMPMDYIISINQTTAEKKATPPVVRFYIIKNRNGPTDQTVTATIDYGTMEVKQQDIHKAT